MHPGQQGRVGDVVGAAVRQGAAQSGVDTVDPVQRGAAGIGVVIGGDGDEFGRAPQPAVHVAAEVGMIPDSGQHRRMQHLQQQARDAADHHGDHVAIDPPRHTVGREQGVGATQDRALAFFRVVEDVADPLTDGGAGGVQHRGSAFRAFQLFDTAIQIGHDRFEAVFL